MTAQLPAVVVVGDIKVAKPLSGALEKTRQFAGVYTATSSRELLESINELPDGRLVYLLSPSATLDMEGITLKDIGDQIGGQGHYVMAVGGDQAGEAFAKETGYPVLRPGKNLVQAIAPVCGIEITPPAPKRPPQQQKPRQAPPKQAPAKPKSGASDEIRRSMVWRDAREAKETSGSRELAPRADSELVWQGAVESSRRQGAMLPGQHRRGYVISFAVRKGGVGKTSLSVNSAAYLGRQLQAAGKRVCLVDMNLQQSDVGNYIHRQSPNVYDIIRNPNLLTDEHIEDALVYADKHNFWALLGPTSLKDAKPETLSFDLYKQILDLLKKRFDYILVDTPVGEFYHAMLSMVLPESNFIIVPVQPARVTLHDVSEWLGHVTAPRHTNGYGLDPRKIGLVLNRAKLGIGLDPPDVEDQLSGWNFIGMIPDSDEWQLAENTGGLVGSNPPKDLDAVFRHMLREATGDKALAGGNSATASAPESETALGKWGRRLKKLFT